MAQTQITQPTYTNPETIKENIFHFQENEVGLQHWQTDAAIRLCDDGCIDIFSGTTIGLRVDPDEVAPSISMFGPQVNVLGKSIHLLTQPNRLLWNNWCFNSQLYEWCRMAPLGVGASPRNFKLKCDYEVKTSKGWEHVETLIPPYLKNNVPNRYSDQIKSLISSYGITL